MTRLPQPGDIWYSSWGYGQTNVNFFHVEQVTKSSIWLQEVGETVEQRSNAWCGVSWPNLTKKIGEVFVRRISQNQDKEYSCKINESYRAYPWTGEPKFTSYSSI